MSLCTHLTHCVHLLNGLSWWVFRPVSYPLFLCWLPASSSSHHHHHHNGCYHASSCEGLWDLLCLCPHYPIITCRTIGPLPPAGPPISRSDSLPHGIWQQLAPPRPTRTQGSSGFPESLPLSVFSLVLSFPSCHC